MAEQEQPPAAEEAGAAAPAAAATSSKKPKTTPQAVMDKLGEKKSLEDITEDELKAILKEYYDRWVACESELYDVEHSVKVKDMQIQELEMEVSDMRGKFIIPKLKKVHTFKLTEEGQ